MLEAVLDYISDGDKWAVDLLRTTCADSAEVAARVASAARAKIGKQQHVLEFCATGGEDPIFAWLEELSTAPAGISVTPEFKTIDFAELDWRGRHDLLVTLLRRHDPALALALLGGSIPVKIAGLGSIDIGDARPWLAWTIELIEAEDDDNAEMASGLNLSWLASQLAYLIARSSAPPNKAQLLKLLEHGDDRTRQAVGHMVMPYVEGLTINDLTDVAIAFLTQLIHTRYYSEFSPHAFGHIASEAFLREHLLPMAATGDVKTRANIACIAETAGKRLGLRFVLPPVTTSH